MKGCLLRAVRNFEDDFYYYVIFEAYSGTNKGKFNLQVYSKQFSDLQKDEWFTTVESAEQIIFASSREAYE